MSLCELVGDAHAQGGCTELLLNHGASLEVVDFDGYTPLMHAALYGGEEALSLLLRAGANLGTGHADVTASALAMLQGHTDAARLLVAEAEARLARAGAIVVQEERVAAMAAVEQHATVSPTLTAQGANVGDGGLHVNVTAASNRSQPPAKVRCGTRDTPILPTNTTTRATTLATTP